jgi:hypothetical protein
MKTLGLATGLALAAAAGSASAAYGYNNGYYNNGYSNNGYNSAYNNGYGRTVRCESRDNRTVYCGVDTSGGVTLVQQNSQNSCVRGRTWGADGRGIWVSRGCRGTFAINDRYGNSAYGYNNRDNDYNNRYGNSRYTGRVVRCESRDGRTRYCSIDTRYGVGIVNQHSDRPCIEGNTWGVSRNRVWVTGGCRADFATGASRYGYNNGYYDRRY